MVDPEGRPAAGVWVTPLGSFGLRGQFTRTDAAGQVHGPQPAEGPDRALVPVRSIVGGRANTWRTASPTRSRSSFVPRTPHRRPRRQPAPAVPEPPALGRPAPPLQVVGWTDGKSHSLADYRGKVVFLDFWGIWCSACINGMPSLERLKQKYEPRGVVFLSIHTPGEEIGKIRRFLDLKKATLISALDEDRGQHDNSLQRRDGRSLRREGLPDAGHDRPAGERGIPQRHRHQGGRRRDEGPRQGDGPRANPR